MHKKKEEKEDASVMFQKIANAYEVSAVMRKIMTLLIFRALHCPGVKTKVLVSLLKRKGKQVDDSVYDAGGKKEEKMTLLGIPALNKRCYFRHFPESCQGQG